jgi:hypothetical protein
MSRSSPPRSGYPERAAFPRIDTHGGDLLTPGRKQPTKPQRKIAMFGLNFRRRRAGLHNKKFVSQRHSPLPFDAFYSPFTMEKGGCFDK